MEDKKAKTSEFFTTPQGGEQSFGHYTNIEQAQGRSSVFNELYTAQRDGKRYILKTLKKERRNATTYLFLLRKEFEIAYPLDHINICRTIAYEVLPELGGTIVMEYIDGRTLDKYLLENPSAKERFRIVEQLCSALDYAHKKQIIHRDIKPQNIIVTYNGDNVRLIDFGLSDTDYHTALKAPAGSRQYASPEQLSGEFLTNRSDIYSLGVLIGHIFKNDASSAIRRVVQKCCKIDSKERFATAGEVAKALSNRSKLWIYPLLAIFFLALGAIYLTQRLTKNDEAKPTPEFPTAQSEGISQEEFQRRFDHAMQCEVTMLMLAGKSYPTPKYNSGITDLYRPLYNFPSQDSIAIMRSAEEYFDSKMSKYKGGSIYKFTKFRCWDMMPAPTTPTSWKTLKEQHFNAFWHAVRVYYIHTNGDAPKPTKEELIEWITTQRTANNAPPIPDCYTPHILHSFLWNNYDQW